MKVEKAQGAPVTRLAFNVGDVQHVRDIQDVSIEMRPVETIRHISWQVREIGVTDEFLDLNVISGQTLDLRR